uniref:response regulator transcription factor n=1 Tax=Sphingomonas bacterium TaxID=1895847 RepID=UPI0026164186|nr:response regulator [Sphingomonas bacterium]
MEDDDAVRASVHALLSMEPSLAVRSFRSGDAFLEEAGELDSGVLLLDLHMPGSSGLDVLHALHELGPRKFATVVVTGQGDIDLAIEAMKAGAVNLIEKPYEAKALLSAIDAAFAGLAHEGATAARGEQARAKIDGLSAREREVLLGLLEGRANKVMALALEISSHTVAMCRANLMTKLDVSGLPGALHVAFAAGLIPTR